MIVSIFQAPAVNWYWLRQFPAKNILKQYIIDTSKSKEMIDELRILGVSRTTLFPDLDSLAADLTKLFRPDLAEDAYR